VITDDLSPTRGSSASLCGRATLVTKLLSKGADPELADEDGSKPVDLAEGADVKAAFTR